MKKYLFLFIPMLISQTIWAQTIFQENGKFGVKSKNKIVIPAIYDQIKPYNEQQKYYPKEEVVFEYYSVAKDGKHQFVSIKDWLVFPDEGFEAIAEKSEDVIENISISKQKGLFGLYNLEKKQWTIPPSYQGMKFLYLYADHVTLFGAKIKGKYGVINIDNQVIIDFKYADVLSTEIYGSIQIKEEEKFTLYTVDTQGETEKAKRFFSKLNYDLLGEVVYQSDYESQIITFKNNGKWGLIDQMSIEYPAIYDKITPIISRTSGRDSLDEYLELNKPINGDYVELQKDGLKGLIKLDYPKNKEVFPVAYQAYDFTNLSGENTFILKKDDKWGLFIPTKMKLKQVEYTYANMKMLEGKTMIVAQSSNGKFGLLGADGKELLPAEYDEISYKSNNSVTVKKDGKEEVKTF